MPSSGDETRNHSTSSRPSPDALARRVVSFANEALTGTNLLDSSKVGASCSQFPLFSQEQSGLLFRGPRLRCGIDVGPAHGVVDSFSGRMEYHGRIMNRAARVSQLAKPGQGVCALL
jgi:class 3 adenylate cyclase